MQDPTPATWVDGTTALSDATFNTEIRDAYLLLLNPPTCSVHLTGSVTLPVSAGWTALSWDTLLFDTEAPADPMYSAGSPTRITVKTAGWYECVASAELMSVPGQLTLSGAFRVGGSVYYMGSSVTTNPTYGPLDVSVVNLLKLNANDYIELVFNHTYSSALTLDQRGLQPTMTISRRRGQ